MCMYMLKCRESNCNSSQLTKNGAGTLFCDGRAWEPRGVVFRPVRMDNGGQTERCDVIVNGSVLVDKQPPPMNCEASDPRM